MDYPKFDIKKYFTENYGLGYRPTINKLKLNKVGVILTAVCLILTFVVHILLILGFLALGFFFIVKPIMNKTKEANKQKEWDAKFEYCRTTWYKEYEKLLKQTIEKLDAKRRGMERIGIMPEKDENGKDMWIVEPFCIKGKNYDGYYRTSGNGEYRTDGHEITWFYFDEAQVYIYNVKFKLTDPSKLKESEQQFIYKDITTVTAATASTFLKASNNADTKKDAKDETIDAEVFTLSVYGEKFTYSFTTTPEVHNSINGMKSLIRQKKLEK